MTKPTRVLRQQLAEDIGRLVDAYARLATAHQLMAGDQEGYPTRGDGGGSDADAVALTPTERAALSTDRARRDLRALEDAITLTTRAADSLHGIVTRWNPDRAPERPPAATSGGDLGCQMVARIKHTSGPRKGQPHWEPTFRNGDVAGNLDRPYRLGRWAYEWVRSTGRLPTRAETLAHLEGRRIKRPA